MLNRDERFCSRVVVEGEGELERRRRLFPSCHLLSLSLLPCLDLLNYISPIQMLLSYNLPMYPTPLYSANGTCKPRSSHPARSLSSSSPPRSSATMYTRRYSVASTLPLWKDKKNVTITYSPIPQHPPTTFDDLVSYNKKTDPPGKQPSTVRGVDKLEEGSGARWKWCVVLRTCAARAR